MTFWAAKVAESLDIFISRCGEMSKDEAEQVKALVAYYLGSKDEDREAIFALAQGCCEENPRIVRPVLQLLYGGAGSAR